MIICTLLTNFNVLYYTLPIQPFHTKPCHTKVLIHIIIAFSLPSQYPTHSSIKAGDKLHKRSYINALKVKK